MAPARHGQPSLDHRHPPKRSPTTAICEHVHVGYRCIYRHDVFTCSCLSIGASEVPVMSAFVLQKINFELREIFLLACDCFVGYYILFHIHHMLIYLMLNQYNEQKQLLKLLFQQQFVQTTAWLSYMQFYKLRLQSSFPDTDCDKKRDSVFADKLPESTHVSLCHSQYFVQLSSCLQPVHAQGP